MILHKYWQRTKLDKLAKDHVHAAMYLSSKLAGLHYDYEKDFAKFICQEAVGSREKMKCLEMDIIHRLEYSLVFTDPFTLLCGYFLQLQVTDCDII